MKIEGLTPEQQERFDASETPEEILAIAREVGYELNDEELDAISGGRRWCDNDKVPHCPTCLVQVYWTKSPRRGWHCPRCKRFFGDNLNNVLMKLPD